MVATGPEGLFDARIDTKRRRIGRAYDFVQHPRRF